MSLFITTTAIIFTIILIVGSLMGLINYTIKQVKGSREQKIAERHDTLIQEKHFKKEYENIQVQQKNVNNN